MALVWVTGTSGTGKSSVCEVLKQRGERAFDADFEGFNAWVHRETGERVVDPPYPVPSGWTDEYAWCINREMVEGLTATARTAHVYLFGSIENEVDVWELFDLVVCLVADDETLRHRLANRTTNEFGKHHDELAKILTWNRTAEADYRGFGASIVDATKPLAVVAAEVVETAMRRSAR